MEIQNNKLRLGRREIGLSIIGALAYGVLSILANFSELAGALGADIRPAVAVPIFMGFAFGPIVGFFTGFFGNFLIDGLAGFLSYPHAFISTGNFLVDVTAGFYLNYQVGSGLLGLIPGIMSLYHKRYTKTLLDALHTAIYIVIAVVAGIGFSVLVDYIIYSHFVEIASPEALDAFAATFAGVDASILTPELISTALIETVFLPIMRHNLLIGFLLVFFLLFNYERLNLRQTNWLRSGLLRRFSTSVVISAAIPTLLLGFFMIQTSGNTGEDSTTVIRLLFTVVITLIFTVVNSLLLAQTISLPLFKLINAANLIRENKFEPAQAEELKHIQTGDELGQLSQVFGDMALQVIEREASLIRQVEELKIEIDTVKQNKQVSEITDNEFFRDLQTKAKILRRRDGLSTSEKLAEYERSKEAQENPITTNSADNDAVSQNTSAT